MIRLSEAEKQLLDGLASERGLTRPDVIRLLLRGVIQLRATPQEVSQ